ncbi:MAG: NAD(+)/NADH kinase [Verrucomicrobiales bacterium]
MKVAVVAHPRKKDSPGALQKICGSLRRKGVEVIMDPASAGLLGEEGREDFWEGADFVISLGGDGTLLETVHRVGARDLIVAGVNIGNLGFLTACSDEMVEKLLERMASGDFTVSERAMLRVRMVERGGKGHEFLALNEVCLMRGETGRLITLEARVNGDLLNRYRADGLLVATPTGSTAYSLAAGGPLMDPEAKALVINPICPHSLSNRALVVSDEARIELKPTGSNDQPVLFTVDGRDIFQVEEGSVVYVEKHPHPVRLIKMEGYSFYETLRKKLNWNGG